MMVRSASSTGTIPVLHCIETFEASPRTFGQMLADRATHDADQTAFTSFCGSVVRATTRTDYLADLGELTLKATIRRGNILASFADPTDEVYEGLERDQISGRAHLSRRGHG